MKSIADGCRCPGWCKFEFSFVGNDRRPSQKSGTHQENRNAPDSPALSLFIPDDRGYLRFRVFISRQNLGRPGNSKIQDRLGFSQHMKNRILVPLRFFFLRNSNEHPVSFCMGVPDLQGTHKLDNLNWSHGVA